MDDVDGPAEQSISSALSSSSQWFSVLMKDTQENAKNSYHVRFELEDPSGQLRFVAIRGGNCDLAKASPEVREYDWCVALSGGGVGHGVCGKNEPNLPTCVDFSSAYLINVRRASPGGPACLPFSLKMTARAGACPGLTSVCGGCSADEGYCSGEVPFRCSDGELRNFSPCEPKVCHSVACVDNGICKQTPLPVGTPCSSGVCTPDHTCGCKPGLSECILASGNTPAKQKTCGSDGLYTEKDCPNGCSTSTGKCNN